MSVSDNGPGVAIEDQTQIFERFAQQGKSATANEGFGVGLALAKWVIEAQQWRHRPEKPPAPRRARPCTRDENRGSPAAQNRLNCPRRTHC
ncbi:sensor histidine kinase [Roseobacter sp.]|uniref:sensor histidine kinase n=1 Tax=Roseobacter sp. TaxID=1907202 RepID=UPI00296631E5|nr:ATP-binding protein [Roseobacter sp.]MDW3183298.1 ATP-binding protein [Roseobacter sp.]